MTQCCGVYAAVVINNSDPLNLNRCQLQIPQILGTSNSNWAVPLSNFTVTPPAVRTRVYAIFISGDVSYPAYFVSPLTGGTLSGSLNVNGSLEVLGDIFSFTGRIGTQQAGKGITVKEGSNAKQGTAVLVAGQVVVANTSVTATSRIFLTSQVDGGTPGFLRVSTRVVGTSFTIQSSSASDTSTVAYEIFEPTQ